MPFLSQRDRFFHLARYLIFDNFCALVVEITGADRSRQLFY
jgi:hypothetical protein